ncbi:MAG: tetratricopeptide repeat protein [Bacteroidota bacterium]|nr:tetratricopeptide repeat protein [Bacteroidota bacterium]
MNKNLNKAKDCFVNIIKLDSNNIPALEYLIRIANGKHPDISIAYIRHLIRLQPDKAAYYRKMGEIYSRKHLTDSARLFYSEAYRRSPQDSKNAAGYAAILLDTKNITKADSILKAVLDKDSLNINCLRLSVRSAYEAKNYPLVIQPGEKLIRLEESYPTALTQLLLAYYNLEKYDDCIRICEYMLRNEMDGESVYYYEAKAYAKLNNPKESNELLQICLAKSISKTAEIYYYSLGENYEILKNYKKAIANYDTAYYLFKNPVMLYNCGRISESNLHNEKLAKKYYALYLKSATPQTVDEKKAYEFVRSRNLKKKKPNK